MISPQAKSAEPTGSARIGLGIVEFVIIIALMTASISLGIDSMLPALPNIGQSLAVANPNDTQMVIAVYFLGFGICQLFSAAWPTPMAGAIFCSAASLSIRSRCLPPPGAVA